MNLMDDLKDIIEKCNYANRGNRCFTKKLVFTAIEEDLLEDVLEKVFNTIVSADLDRAPLAAMARRVTTRMANSLGIELIGPKGVIKTGMEILDWYAKIGMLKAVKKDAIEDKGGKLTKKTSWFIDILVEMEHKNVGIFCDPRKPFRPWTTATRYEEGHVIPLVKRADQLKILDYYTPEKIPMMYKAINRLGATTWEINTDLLGYANNIDSTNSPLGELADSKTLAMAYRNMGNEKASKAKRKLATSTIGKHEKRNIFDTIHDMAIDYQGHDLHFTHNFCGRGRQYALAPHLNPQGADIAKALLVLKNKVPLVEHDFWIHLANCAGEDKLTYDGRIKWVNDNIDMLTLIGNDPIANYELIQSIGVDKEKKTYYQFIACCIELSKYLSNPTDYETGIMLGLDSTSSGNQILAMIAKDHEVAEYVNISPTKDGTPGDLYRYVGKFVQQGLKDFKIEDLSPKLQPYVDINAIKRLADLPIGHKGFRKITKRPCMVLPYSGTRYGAGEITKADQFDHGFPEIEALNFGGCTAVGAVIYDQCVISAKRSMDILKYLRDGIDYCDNELVITWTIPQTNFTAFQIKENMKEASVVGNIGDQAISLKVYLPTGTANKNGHKNSIAPGVVHSLDAAMLTMIVNTIPDHLDVAAIHDQFCVPMGHMDMLIDAARDSYASVACRENFSNLCESAFGIKRELPLPGRWDISELADTKYFIC